MSENVTEIKQGTHAHYCVFCASQGIETIWAHGNECAGKLDQHRCPRCGHVEWHKMTIASAKLPESQTQASGQAIQVVTLQDAVISCIIYAIGLVALCYGVLFIYGKFIQKKATK